MSLIEFFSQASTQYPARVKSSRNLSCNYPFQSLKMDEMEKEFIEDDFTLAVSDAFEADEKTDSRQPGSWVRRLSFKDLAPE